MNSSDLTGKTRRSFRLANYDYAMCGAYFVTLCAHQRRPVFGRVLAGEMHLNIYGEMVRDEWLRTAEVRSNVVLDELIVMPDHLHAILLIVENRPDIVAGDPLGRPRRRR